MSEMEYEPAPQVHVRRVNPWLASALRDWTQVIYPPGHITVVWGCLFVVPWALWQAAKFCIWLAGVILAVLYYPLHVTIQLTTYQSRYKRAVLASWGPYMGELHGKTPPALEA